MPTLDDLKTRAGTWLEPIPGPSPAGAVATQHPTYQAVRAEIERLNAPAGGAVDWAGLSQKTGDLLRTTTKDLLIASVLAHALHATRGAEGLGTGATLLAELMERYWETMQPDVKRTRGRANALAWFLERSATAASLAEPPPPEVAEVTAQALRRLAEVSRARLGEAAPAFGPVLEAVERWRAAAPPPEAAPPTPPEAAPASAPPAPAAPPPPGLPADLASAADAPEFLRRLGGALEKAGATLRAASAADPSAYRVLRVGLWLHLPAAPPAPGGRTAIQPPPEALRTRLGLMAQNQRWAELLEEAESALPSNRFALELQRNAHLALAALGPSHLLARDAVAAEVRALLSRMPALPGLLFADGSPLADPPVKAWLDEAVLPRAAAPAAAGPSEPAGGAAPLAEAAAFLAAGRVPEGLAAVQAAVQAARSGRERFRLRLELARLLARSGLAALARGLYEELAREADSHALAEWEPALIVDTLKGLIAVARSPGKDSRGSLSALGEHYERLCRLDPAAAHEVWP